MAGLSRYSIRERLLLMVALQMGVALAIVVAQPAWQIAGLLVFASGVIAFALAMSIVRPVVALQVASSQIDAGQMDIDIPHQNLNDEIGDVARALDTFRSHLHEMREHHAAERLRGEEERIKAIEALTTTYQQSLQHIVNDVAGMATQLAEHLEHKQPAGPQTDETVH